MKNIIIICAQRHTQTRRYEDLHNHINQTTVDFDLALAEGLSREHR